MAALRALYSAIMFPDQTVLILAPVQRQAQILFRRIKFFLNKNAQMPKERRIPLINMIERETQTVIEFSNGSALYCLPISEDGKNIKGFTANDITIDEAQHVNDAAWAAINPMLATTSGNLRLIGTAYGQNNMFYKWYALAERKKECNMWEAGIHFSTYHFPSNVSPLIDDVFLAQESERLPHMEYMQEYEGVFLETVGTLWTEKLVNSVMKEDCPDRSFPIPQYRYYLGYDVARFGDDDAVGVILERRIHKEDEKYFIVNTFEMRGKSLDFQVKFLKDLHKLWGFEKMIIDTTAVGGGITDPLKAASYPVDEFNFSIKSKQEAYFHTTRLLESGTLILPLHSKMKKQMVEMKREERSDGFTKIYHPSKTGGDDYCFVGDTLILTDEGQVPIKDINIGDKVLTRKGFNKVIATSNRLANTITRFGLTGTPDHPIITKSGTKKLINLNAIDITYTWNEKLLSIVEGSIIDTLSQKEDNSEFIIGHTQIGTNHPFLFTGKYGKTTLVKSQRTMLSTTKMKIPQTTQLKTSNSLQKADTKKFIVPNQQKRTWKNMQDQDRLIGLEHMQRLQKGGQILSRGAKKEGQYGINQDSNTNVFNVEKNIYPQEESKPISVQSNASKIITGKQEKSKNIVEDIVRRRVYNLTIEDAEEYFANNILVHNCTALVLACWGIKRRSADVLFAYSSKSIV